MTGANNRPIGAPRAKHSFRNLASWQKAQALSGAILDVVDGMPNTRAAGVLIQQIVKSSSSIAANICEGHGRFSAGAYRNHLSIARGSANETIGWLDLLRRRGYILEQRQNELIDLTEEILSMISAQMIQLDRQTGNAKAFREERTEYVVE
jgi:four helix bundle protein